MILKAVYTKDEQRFKVFEDDETRQFENYRIPDLWDINWNVFYSLNITLDE